MQQQDYYQVLGVKKTASLKQIKNSYRELAFKYHPDRNKDNPKTADKMKIVNEAYAVLSNTKKRGEYDLMKEQYGSSAYNQFRKNYSEQDIFQGSDLHHVFEEMAKTFGFRGFDDVFQEFYGQGFQTFDFRKPGFFAKGFIYMGSFNRTDNNRTSFLPGGRFKQLAGSVLKKISQMHLPEKGGDIYDIIYLSQEFVGHGGPYAYFLKKKSRKLIVKIPSGIKEGQKIRLTGMGEDGKSGGDSGDLYLKVSFKKPVFTIMKETVENVINRLTSNE